jgi:shikimate kinase
MKEQNIVLIGLPGTGKTSVGRELSLRLGWTFLDTDELIEQQEQTEIPQIFASRGEAYFRSVESRVIEEVMKRSGQVVATGGGAVLSQENSNRMKENGWVVCLKASAEVIIERVSQNENRPLVKGDVEAKVRGLMEQRKYAYNFADMQIETSSLPVEEIAAQILMQRQKMLELK